jgi:NADH-quinone oxidoreductase subunit K
MVGLHSYLIVAVVLFAVGLCGVLVRRNALTIFMSIELMLNAANLTFLAFSRYPLRGGSPTNDGHAIAFFVMAVAAAEAAVGLAIVIAAFRVRGSINVDELRSLRN